MSDWIKALQKARLTGVEEVPKGWKTVHRWAEESGLRRAQTYVNLEQMLRAGVVEKKNFRVPVGSFARATPHYKLR
jgi:hypothetical protein